MTGDGPVRPAEEADLPAILRIHNREVLEGTALWSTVPVDLANRRALLAERQSRGYPFLVAVWEGEVAGYGSFGDFRPQDGFVRTVEHSVYVDARFQRRGLAGALLQALIVAAREAGKHTMVGGIDATNVASLALHRRHGFVETARMPQVGFKFGRYLDLVFVQRVVSA